MTTPKPPRSGQHPMTAARLEEIKDQFNDLLKGSTNQILASELSITFQAFARVVIPDLVASLESAWSDLQSSRAEVERLQAKLERCQMFAQTWKDQVTVYKDEVSSLQKLLEEKENG